MDPVFWDLSYCLFQVLRIGTIVAAVLILRPRWVGWLLGGAFGLQLLIGLTARAWWWAVPWLSGYYGLSDVDEVWIWLELGLKLLELLSWLVVLFCLSQIAAPSPGRETREASDQGR